jgi:hypothetical protein
MFYNGILNADDNYGGGEAARWALEQPPLRTILIDRQGRATPVSLPDPRAWCILRYMAVGETSVGARETSLELNSCMARLAQEAEVSFRDGCPSPNRLHQR